jgi:hypothetical protein
MNEPRILIVLDVYSTELEIRLSFVKTSEFPGGGGEGLNFPRYATNWTGDHYKSISFPVSISMKPETVTSHYEIFYIEFHSNL